MCGLKVLSVGLSEFATLVRDALLLRAHSKLAVVTNYGDLCSVSLQREEFQAAVLNEPNPRVNCGAGPDTSGAHSLMPGSSS